MTADSVLNIGGLVIAIILLINIVVAIITLFLERRDSASLWAWILVLTLIPVIGFVLYLFIGRRISHRRIFKLLDGSEVGMRPQGPRQRAQIARDRFEFANEVTRRNIELITLLMNDDIASLSDDNAVQVYQNGPDKFSDLISDIRAATDHIHILYYIFRPDAIGQRVLDALVERAEAGVTVRLCFDAYGGRKTRGRAVKRLLAAGGEVYSFFPNNFGPINFRVNFRTHRKIAVIDGRVGYVGGYNVGDEYVMPTKRFGPWRDTHLRIEGSAVDSLQTRFLMDWNVAAPESRRVGHEPRYFPARTEPAGSVAMQIVSSGPDSDWEWIKYGYLKAISEANTSIKIQTPYFMPDAAMFDALKIAALSGVEVHLMIPDKPDHPLVYPATLSYADELAALGAHVHIYAGGFLHAKTLLIDDELASVGTANFDHRSFRLNFEVNAFIYDAELGRTLAGIYAEDLLKCRDFHHDQLYRRPLVGRIKEGASRLITPLL
ncbi:cardiolipin synthase [Microlunatus soli]|uniref:Cardiolipin synthase n=1 Tax=Microlunatus soli TaxID=630515 RepID=A0A1H1X2Q0_9ACTN|nr:cardiolipin synthase [Microlunatus soli]SDT03633.1 cardiolipin synthetase 2 [Microlunatus soli]